jgi:thiol-disulfide isomerase/thioredoxin
MNGTVNIEKPTTCLVKFYSNNCHLCHALSTYYIDISELDEFQNINFYAYNIDTDSETSKKLRLNGVPSIVLFNVFQGQKSIPIVLKDPVSPNKETWYTVKDITDFISDNTDHKLDRKSIRKRRSQRRRRRLT